MKITVETYEEEEDDQSVDEDDSGEELESAKGTLSPGIRESNNEYDRNSEEMDSNGGNQEEDSEEEEEEEEEDEEEEEEEEEDDDDITTRRDVGNSGSTGVLDPHNSNRRVFFSEDDSRDGSSEVVSPKIGPVLRTFQKFKAREVKQFSFNKWRNISGNVGSKSSGSGNNSSSAPVVSYDDGGSGSLSQKRKRSSGDDSERNGKISGKRSSTPTKKMKSNDSSDIKSAMYSSSSSSNANHGKSSQSLPFTNNNNKLNEWYTGEHGLRYMDLKLGEGETAVVGKKIKVAYEGKLANTGKIFEKNQKGFDFYLGKGKVLKGWDLGIAGMKIGGRRIIRLPPHLAYGSKGYEPFIPKDAPLEFTIDVLRVIK